MSRTKQKATIRTADYGGMPAAHGKFGEKDRAVSGAEWEVSVEDVQKGNSIKVGRLLFEGLGAGLNRLNTFDEMLGCNKCNDMYHRDTRYGPFINDGGSIRKPLTAKRSISTSSCKKYRVTVNKAEHSVTFEGGPGAVANFPGDNKQHPLW